MTKASRSLYNDKKGGCLCPYFICNFVYICKGCFIFQDLVMIILCIHVKFVDGLLSFKVLS